MNSEEVISKNRQPSVEDCRFLELLTGFEPVTSSLPRMRATDCAIAARVCLNTRTLYNTNHALSTSFLKKLSNKISFKKTQKSLDI